MQENKKRRTVIRSPFTKTFLSALSQRLERFLDLIEVRHVLWVLLCFRVLNHAFFIDHEGGTLGHAPHDEVSIGQEALVSDPVISGGLVLVVGKQSQLDALLLGPLRLREGVVAGDADDGSVEAGVFVQLVRDRAEFGGATASEGHGHEEKYDVLFADVLRKSEKFRAFLAEGDEGEIGGFGSS